MEPFLSIVTYVRAGSHPDVRKRLPAAIASLEATGFGGPVWIVDDCSDDTQHLDYLADLSGQGRYNLYLRSTNGGTSRAKNTCLRLFEASKNPNGFIAEDDILFKRAGWWDLYVQARLRTGIQHFSYAVPGWPGAHRRLMIYPGCELIEVDRLNGVLLFVTQAVVRKLGGFRVYETPWGAGHSQFTLRAKQADLTPGYVDVADSANYIGLNKWAHASVTSEEDRVRYAAILKRSHKHKRIHYPLEE